MTQFPDQFRSRVISKLIKSISRVLQKLLGYFNGTIISIFYVRLLPVLPVDFSLRLKKLVVAFASVKLVIAPLSSTVGTSLQNCHKIAGVSE